MTTFQELRDAEPGVFTRDAQRWQELAKAMGDRGADVDRHLTSLEPWQGAASEAAKQTIGDQRKKLAHLAEQLSRIPPVLSEVGDRLSRAQQTLLRAMSIAEANSLRIHSDGQVTDDAVVLATPPRPGQPNKAQLAAELSTTLKDALREAGAADAEAAAALRRITQEATGLTPGASRQQGTVLSASIPKPGTAPAEVKKWWDALSIADREALLASDGARIGALDGIPAVTRDRANRVVLAALQASASEEKTRLEAKAHRTEDDQARLTELTGKLEGMDAIIRRLGTAPSDAAQQPFLLGISATGNGRAIVAMGNPDTATNVATYVPGTFASLASCKADLEHADAMSAAASKAGSPSTSVITWVGYDAPQSLVPEAAEEKFADGAKQDLARFQDGLRVTHEGAASHNTVVGHSYGSTVVGHTARDEQLKADEVVFIGSPGVGVDHASDLHLPPEHVHSSVAEHDIIHITNIPLGISRDFLPLDPLGPDPADAHFGGSTFTSDPGTEGPFWQGGLSEQAHNQYWDDNSKSLKNMGKVIAGKPTD